MENIASSTTTLVIPDPVQLNETRAQLTTPLARAKRMLLDKIMINVVQCIKKANDINGAAACHIARYDVYPTVDALSPGEQLMIMQCFPAAKKGQKPTEVTLVALSRVIREREAYEHIRVRLHATSHIYHVKQQEHCVITISWAM